MKEPTFPLGTPLTIEPAANGFVVREALTDGDFRTGRIRSQEVLVFNHLGAGLLAFLGRHFESAEDRAAREARAAEPVSFTDPLPQPAKPFQCALASLGKSRCDHWCGGTSTCRPSL